jgi:Bacterial Ig-like domain
VSVSQSKPSTQRGRQRLSAGVVATALAALALPLVATPASALLNPNLAPAAPHSIIVFPNRDFIHIDGYAAAPVTVQVLRGGIVVGTTLPFTPGQPDPANPGLFMEDINHVGQPCWSGVTPDIRGNDVVKVLTSATTGDQTPAANVIVTQVAKVVGATVTVKGSAVSATGGQFPIDQLESRIVANKQAFSNGKRTLRADSLGVLDGTIAYDSPTATTWTATYTKLGPGDAALAVANDSRAMWLGRNPLAVNEETIAEVGAVIFPGPAVGCFAPAAVGPSKPAMTAATDTGSSSTDGITNNVLPTFAGVTDLATATSVNLIVDGVLNGTAPVVAGRYSLTPTIPLTPGAHTITASEVGLNTAVPAAVVTTLGNAASTITVDTLAPRVLSHTLGGVRVPQATNITATFSEDVSLAGASVTLKKTFTGAPVGGVISYNAATRVATLNPTASLAPATRYTASLTTNIKDLAGNPIPATSWVFETGPRPTVMRVSPAANLRGVNRLANISARISENVRGINRTTVFLRKVGTAARIRAVVSYNATTHIATLNPSVRLAGNTRYVATLSGLVTDADGNRITTKTWTFRTRR